jgi:hypothetical protein
LPEQSHLVPSPAELMARFYCHLRLPQPGGTGPRIYISQAQGGSAIPSGTGFGQLIEVEVIVTLRPTVIRPVRLSVMPLFGASDQMLLHLFE